MADPWLNEEQTWRGKWWLPSEPTNAQPGILGYSPSAGLELTLIGGFEDTVRTEVAPGVYTTTLSDAVMPVIHGVSSGKAITLLDCRVTHSSSHSSRWFDGPDEQTVIAQQAVVGAHLTDADGAVFARASCLVEDSLAWAGSYAISAKMKVDRTTEGPLGSIDLTEVETLRAEVGPLGVELFHSLILPHFDRRRRGVTALVRDAAVFSFIPDKPFSLTDASEAVRSVQNLIALASGRDPALLWMTAQLASADPNVFGGRVDVYRRSGDSAAPEAAARDGREFVFTLDDMPFEHLLPRWAEVQARFRSSCNIVLGARYADTVYLENSVINAVTAAEAFHKALDEPWPIPKDELESLIQLAVDAMPDERKAWMRNFIPRGHSLKQRLMSLSARIPEAVRSKLLPSPIAWAGAAVLARNGLSHAGKSTDDWDALYAVIRVTDAVVVVNLLVELGISEERILRALSDNHELAFTCSLAAKNFSASP